MGVFGWTVLRQEEKLEGVVTEHYRSADDGDWNIVVQPDPAYAKLAINAAGVKNDQGKIECEVEITNSIDSDATHDSYCKPLLGKHVTLTGAWVEDDSHGKKTELHPIYTLLRDDSPKDAPVRKAELFVFSDDSGLVHVPYGSQSHSGWFVIPYGPGGDCAPAWKILKERDMSSSKRFDAGRNPQTGQYNLLVRVSSGVAPDEGFYHAVIELYFDKTKAFHPEPTECASLRHQIQDLQYKVDHTEVETGPDGKPEPNSELDQMRAQLKALKQKYASLPCYPATSQVGPRQTGWRWCNKCMGMWFNGSGSMGKCSGGSTHSTSGSGNYSLVNNLPRAPGQHGWRWCNKCMGLWFNGGGSMGKCFAGGTHSTTGSGDYSIHAHVTNGPGQGGWRWCDKCEGLWFHGGASLGQCPGGGTHVETGSGNYGPVIN